MKCSKCDYMNPLGVEFCQSCSHKLACDSIGEFEKGNMPVSAFRVCLRWIWVSIRVMALPVLLGILDPLAGVITGLGAITRAIYNWNATKNGFYQKSKFWFGVRSAGWVTLFAVGIFVNVDAPPIKDDFTVKDLRSADAKYAESYALLKQILPKHTPEGFLGIGLTNDDVDMLSEIKDYDASDRDHQRIKLILEREDGIRQAWVHIGKVRENIGELAQYEEIADLSKCSMEEQQLGFGFVTLIDLYNYYAILEHEKGNTEGAIREIIAIDKVTRRYLINARSLISRLVCVIGIKRNIWAINHILNSPDTSDSSISIIAEHFKPLRDEHLSMRNAILFEYLSQKETHQTLTKQVPIKRFFKQNSSLRIHRNICTQILYKNNLLSNKEPSYLSLWPWEIFGNPKISFSPYDELPLSYRYYNPTGWLITSMAASMEEKTTRASNMLLVHDGLVQFVIGKRLGREVDLSDRAFGGEYVVDLDAEMIYSPGKDGKAFTRDDIKLYIDPEVLGLR